MSDDGIVWRKAGGVWTQTGVDLTGTAGRVAHPRRRGRRAVARASLGKVGDIFFNLDGRVWEKTDDAPGPGPDGTRGDLHRTPIRARA